MSLIVRRLIKIYLKYWTDKIMNKNIKVNA